MLQFLKTAALYVLVTPPLAATAAVLVTSLTALAAGGELGPRDALIGMVAMLPITAIMSYVFGGAQALFVGLGAALWQKLRGPVPLAVPLVLSALAWIAFSLFTHADSEIGEPLQRNMLSPNGALWLAAHLIGGFTGWWLTRRYDL